MDLFIISDGALETIILSNQVLDVPSVNGKCAYDSISLLR